MIVLAVEDLISKISKEFEEEQIAAPILFGWRTPAQQMINGPRITWVPGDTSGAIGTLSSARWPGRVPRPLATLEELFTITITSFDPEYPEDEAKQYRSTRLLFDAWYRALYRAAHGTFTINSSSWVTNRKERRAGAAIAVILALQAKLSDYAPRETVPATAGADLDMKFIDTPDPNIVIPAVGEE